MKIPLQQVLARIPMQTLYPPAIQGLASLTLLATVLNALVSARESSFTGTMQQVWLLIGIVILQLVAIMLVPVRRLACWQQLVFLVGQCVATAFAQIIMPVPIIDYVYLSIVLQAVYLFRIWLWIIFASAVWLVWSGTIIIDSNGLIAWLQSNLSVAFPATCLIIAAIVYARQQQRREQVQQLLRQMQHHYDNLVVTVRDLPQRTAEEERQRLALMMTGTMQAALASTEQHMLLALQQAHTNLNRLHGTITQTQESASAALEQLRAAIWTLRQGDLSSDAVYLTPATSVMALRPPPTANDDLLLPSLTQAVLTWVLPLVFVGLVLPLTLVQHSANDHSLSPALIAQVLLVGVLFVAAHLLTHRIRGSFWLQAALAGQMLSVVALVLLTQTPLLLVGLLLVIWQMSLRCSALQILTFLGVIQLPLGVVVVAFMPIALEHNSLMIAGVAYAAMAVLLWVARYQLRRRQQDEVRLVRLGELTDEVEQQGTEVRTLALATERNRLAREFHDDLGHQLVLIRLQLQVVEELMAEDPDAALDHLSTTREQLRRVWRSVLSTADELLSLDGDTLKPALQTLVQQCQASMRSRITLSIDSVLAPLAPLVACTVYRAVQEGLTNAGKHACAQHIDIRVCRTPMQIQVQICDDGQSLPVATPMVGVAQDQLLAPEVQDSFGLVGLRERAESLHGTMEAGPLPNGGFGLKLVVPLTESLP